MSFEAIKQRKDRNLHPKMVSLRRSFAVRLTSCHDIRQTTKLNLSQMLRFYSLFTEHWHSAAGKFCENEVHVNTNFVVLIRVS